MPRKTFVWGAVMALLLVAGCDRGSHPESIGKPAPQFAIGDGVNAVDLSKLRGHVVIVNIWATYCPPCVEELPSLLEMQQRMPGVEVVAISMDQDEETYRNFLTKHHVNLVTVRDPAGKVKDIYGTVLIPESYVIDKKGILRRKFVSSQDWTSPEILGYLTKLSNERS